VDVTRTFVQVDGCEDDVSDTCGFGDEREEGDEVSVLEVMGLVVADDAQAFRASITFWTFIPFRSLAIV
jgi:hypothetical protein